MMFYFKKRSICDDDDYMAIYIPDSQSFRKARERSKQILPTVNLHNCVYINLLIVNKQNYLNEN